jgi:hypothetical protein
MRSRIIGIISRNLGSRYVAGSEDSMPVNGRPKVDESPEAMRVFVSEERLKFGTLMMCGRHWIDVGIREEVIGQKRRKSPSTSSEGNEPL